MKKKRRASGFLAALAIIIAYFALFPHPLGREIVARPAWTLALPAAESLPAGGISPSQATGSEELIPFQAGSLFGYVSRSGKLVHAEKTLFRVALADGGYVNYTRLGADWVLRNPAGERLFSFRGRGYPLLSAGNGTPRVFVAKTDLTGLQEVDGSGEPLWSRDFPSMITSVSIAPGGLIAGLLNGSAEFVTSRGEAAFSAASSGSRIPVVVGVAASADGSRLATVSGIDPQVLVVYTRKGGGFSETSRASPASRVPAGSASRILTRFPLACRRGRGGCRRRGSVLREDLVDAAGRTSVAGVRGRSTFRHGFPRLPASCRASRPGRL